jgi:Fur family ferric uptake transcriptional regulator
VNCGKGGIKKILEKVELTMRLTNQRQVILEELRKVQSHPTAGELYDMVRKRLPRIGLGTVYRNLEILSESGVIKKLETGGERKRFDGNSDAHYHIRCNGCGKVDDLPIGRVHGLDDQAAECCGYKILGHHIEFVGVCPHCRMAQ